MWKQIHSLVIIIDNISKPVVCLVLGCQNREPIISHYHFLCNGLCGYLLYCTTASPFFMENLLQTTTAHCQLKIFRDPVHSFLHTMNAFLNDCGCCQNSTDWSMLCEYPSGKSSENSWKKHWLLGEKSENQWTLI